MGRNIKDLKINLLEETFAKSLVHTIHNTWKSMRAAMDQHQQDFMKLEDKVRYCRERYSRIGSKLDSNLGMTRPH